MINKKVLFGLCVLAAGFLGGPVFAQTPNDFKIDFTKAGDGLIITGYTGTATRVVIPAEIEGLPVRILSNQAFRKNQDITEVIIPEGVTEIADNTSAYRNTGAFSECTKLRAVSLPRGLRKIGECAFYRCTSLTAIAIPDTVTEIGDVAFYSCSSLVSIIIPNGVKKLGEWMFAYCKKLVSVTIPNSVTQIGDNAFKGSGITSITIPNSVTQIGEYTFYESGITSITIPNSVTQIGDNAFKGSGITSIALPASVKSIGRGAFGDCKNLTTVTLEEGAAINFGRSCFDGAKLDVKSQIALKKAGYTESF